MWRCHHSFWRVHIDSVWPALGTAEGCSNAPLLERRGQQAVKVVAARFTADAEAARVVGAAGEAALHFLADTHIFKLDLVAHGHALGDEAAALVAIGI